MTILLKVLGLAPTHPFRLYNFVFLGFVLAGLALTVIMTTSGYRSLTVELVGMVAGVFLLVYIALLIYGRGYSKDVDDMRGGHYLKKWTYSPEEWELLARMDAHQRRTDSLTTLGVGAGAVVLSAFFMVVIGVPWEIFWVVALVVISMIALLALAMYAEGNKGASASPGERTIYLSSLGILKPWGYTAITGFNLRLTNVRIEEGEIPILVLTSTYLTQYGTKSRDAFMPVPRASVSETQEWVNQLLAN